MVFVDGKCPLCGANIRVPEDKEQCFCQSCGHQILTSAAIAFGSAANTPQKSAFKVQSEPVSNAVPFEAEVVQDKPFLDKWEKTPIGMAILGAIFPAPAIVLYFALALVVALLGDVSNTVFLAAMAAVFVIYIAVSGVYALSIYPSLTTDKPKLKSPNVAAYLNLAFGGIIFGSIWCSALTKKRQSKSQYVFIALLVIALGLSLVSGYLQDYSDFVPGTTNHSITSTNTNNNNATGNTGNTNNAGNAGNVKSQTMDVILYLDDPNASSWDDAEGSVTMSDTSIRLSFTSKKKNYSVSGTYLETKDGRTSYQMNDGNIADYSVQSGSKFITVYSPDKGLLFYVVVE